MNKELESLNLDLLDYIGGYDEGDTLGDMYFPAEGISDSILADTADDRDSLRLGDIRIKENGDSLTLLVSARYKPEEPDEFETDQWGYTKTEPIPAMKFNSLSNVDQSLLSEFVPIAVEKAGGFANFRDTATSTNSLVDRLASLTLPDVESCRSGLERFIEVKARSEEIQERIKNVEAQIDDLVFDLYDISDEEQTLIKEALSDLIEE